MKYGMIRAYSSSECGVHRENDTLDCSQGRSSGIGTGLAGGRKGIEKGHFPVLWERALTSPDPSVLKQLLTKEPGKENT